VHGQRKQFTCRYHGWGFNGGREYAGRSSEDWNGALSSECARLTASLDVWSGWDLINMDPDCEQLRQYLRRLASMLDPSSYRNMRLSVAQVWASSVQLEGRAGGWKRSTKTYLFKPLILNKINSLISVVGPELTASTAISLMTAPKNADKNRSRPSCDSARRDPRLTTAEIAVYTWEKANTNTTQDTGRCRVTA